MSATNGKLSLAPLEKEVDIRGNKFLLREISGDDYDKILKLTTGPDGTAELGPVLRLMVIQSSVAPKLTPEEYGAFPLSVVRALNEAVNELHFGENQQATTS